MTRLHLPRSRSVLYSVALRSDIRFSPGSSIVMKPFFLKDQNDDINKWAGMQEKTVRKPDPTPGVENTHLEAKCITQPCMLRGRTVVGL